MAKKKEGQHTSFPLSFKGKWNKPDTLFFELHGIFATICWNIDKSTVDGKAENNSELFRNESIEFWLKDHKISFEQSTIEIDLAWKICVILQHVDVNDNANFFMWKYVHTAIKYHNKFV